MNKQNEIKYVCKPSIVERHIEDSVFLVGEDNQALYQLDGVGAALWHLLSDPCSLTEVNDVLKQAFPDVTDQTIETDVIRLFHDLLEHRLIFQHCQNSD